MSYDEEEHKRSRVVVETPTARREVVQQQTVRYPQERRSYSLGAVVAVALTAIAVTAIVFLFLTNSRDDKTEANVNLSAAAQPTPFAQAPVIVQTPMTAPTPIIIQQPPPLTTTAPAPVIIQQPPPATTAPPASSAPPPSTAANDDTAIQQKLDKAFANDAEISAANIDATVVNGKALLTGTVNSDALKQRAERVAYAVKGVHSVDNKIVVSP
jgi:hypothetical protein